MANITHVSQYVNTNACRIKKNEKSQKKIALWHKREYFYLKLCRFSRTRKKKVFRFTCRTRRICRLDGYDA